MPLLAWMDMGWVLAALPAIAFAAASRLLRDFSVACIVIIMNAMSIAISCSLNSCHWSLCILSSFDLNLVFIWRDMAAMLPRSPCEYAPSGQRVDQDALTHRSHTHQDNLRFFAQRLSHLRVQRILYEIMLLAVPMTCSLTYLWIPALQTFPLLGSRRLQQKDMLPILFQHCWIVGRGVGRKLSIDSCFSSICH